MKNNLNIGLVGFGSIGERHWRNLQLLAPRSRFIILTKRNDIPGAVRTFSAFRQYGPYDLILICNETYKHKRTILQAIKLKPKVLFVEKPATTTVAEVVAVKRALRKRPIHFFVGYSRQFYKPYQAIKKIIQSGRLGKIYSLHISVGQNLKDWRQRPWQRTYSTKKRQGGGVVLDLVHELNFPGWALNEPLRVKTATVASMPVLPMDAENIAASILISQKGTIVTVHQDCLRLPANWSCRVVGSKSTLTWEEQTSQLVIDDGKKITTRKIAVEWNNMFIAEMKFALGLVGRKKIFSNIDEAERDLKNIEAIKRYG